MEPDGFGWAMTVLQRIVIIDDVALNRRVLESLVADRDDVEVLSFASSAEALKRARSLDASLFITAVRAGELLCQAPVMMITAAEEREMSIRGPRVRRERFPGAADRSARVHSVKEHPA